jgi:ABC-type Fe3+ transport system substrate-binding protein
VIVKQQQTNQAVTYLRETRARPEADIIWASAMDAFQTLKDDGLLDRIALPRETLARMPAKVGGFPLHDSDGQYPSTTRGRPTRPSTTRSRTSPT